MPHHLQPPTAPPQSAIGFDFTAAMRRICLDVVARTPELAHVEMSRVAVTFSQARSNSSQGLFASLTPLRFEHGAETTVRRGRTYTIQRFRTSGGRELLYILSFCMPRFADLCLREKLITVFHELWHISPRFDGDIRRHAGRCYAHTSSQAEFDHAMAILADRWLSQQLDESLWGFLRHSFTDLVQLHGGIHGLRLPRPKMIPVLPRGCCEG